MSLDTNTVRRIARLARLHIPESELDPLASDLSNIIGWVEQLSEVKTDGIEPMTTVVETAPHHREDIVNDGGNSSKVLSNAPDSIDGFYTVIKVIE
jgi:aspartyl-tRNA(Asn)/glutamyl-tRNA(Gln) amidotransferase subunit C